MDTFNYNEAFSRNIGWLTREEQVKVANFRIGISGLGGVGGHHMHALLRLGFQNFTIADLDNFEVQNFNRQFGSMTSTIGVPKAEVLESFAKDINPEVNIRTFNNGISKTNMNDFLSDVDIVIDSLDLFVSALRTPLYELAFNKGIYVMSAAPLGMGTSILTFSPFGMSFNEYFDLTKDNLTPEAIVVRFLAGMSPLLMHSNYLGSPKDVALFDHKLPSLHVGCYAASAAVSSIVLKIAINRGKVLFAPRGYQVDFYHNKLKKFWRPFGNKNPIQKVLIRKMHKMFKVKEFN